MYSRQKILEILARFFAQIAIDTYRSGHIVYAVHQSVRSKTSNRASNGQLALLALSAAHTNSLPAHYLRPSTHTQGVFLAHLPISDKLLSPISAMTSFPMRLIWIPLQLNLRHWTLGLEWILKP
jgi:hypothetical protein